MKLRHPTLSLVGPGAALACAGVMIAVVLAGHPGIACPVISRSRAIHSATGSAKGYSASARLMTFQEFQAGNPRIGQGSIPPETPVWVVAYAGKFPNSRGGFAGWLVVVSEATTGRMMVREGPGAGGWPPYFNQLPDRAWFCPG
jgi:hypothetical protein